MTTETITIPLVNGELEGSDFVLNQDDTQIVTLTDGGELSNISIEEFGTGTPTETGEGPGGDDEFHINLSEFDDDFSVTTKSLDSGDGFHISDALSWSNSGNLYTIDYIGSDSELHHMDIDIQSSNGTGTTAISITCFAAGTMIETDIGLAPVETLLIGDLVKCGDGKSRPIRWMSRRVLLEPEMRRHPEFRPIRIRKGALDDNVPNADLVVSPQHRILINDWRAELLFGEDEVLVPALHLVNDTDILRDFEATQVTYYHFMFDQHQTVFSNNIESESFFPGNEAIEGIEEAARAELFHLFPKLENDIGTYGETYRPTLKAHEAMAMVGL